MARSHRITCGAGLASAGLLIAIVAAEDAPPAPVEHAAAVQFIGQSSRITQPSFELIRDEASWAWLWARHTGAQAQAVPPTRHAAPVIDFSRFMVIGAFNGTATNTDGLVARSISTDETSVRVRFETSSFQTASFGPGPDHGVTTTCYGLWVIDRSDKPIIIEEGVQQLKDAPVQWSEVKRFAGQ